MRALIYMCLCLLIISCSKAKEIQEKNIVPEIVKKENPSKGLLECKETSFYAGKVSIGQPIEHTFYF